MALLIQYTRAIFVLRESGGNKEHSPSKLPVQPPGEHRHRTAVAVERRIDDELVVHAGVQPVPDLNIIVGLQRLLPAVGQGAVAAEDARAARGKEFLVDVGHAVGNACQPEGVLRAVPKAPFTPTPKVAVRSTSLNTQASRKCGSSAVPLEVRGIRMSAKSP